MDNKNEDSGGSDSLDKNLQQKCKVDDLNQIDGNLVVELTPAKQIDSVGDGTDVRDKHLDGELNDQFEQMNSFHKTQKTENYSNVNGINAAATEARESSLRFFKASSTITGAIFSRDDGGGSSIASCNANSSNTNSLEGNACNIESSVKQISQNLKQTKLENSIPPTTTTTTTITTTTTTTISASKSSTSLDVAITNTPSDSILSNLDEEIETPNAVDEISENANSLTEVDSSTVIDSDAADNLSDNRSKKVRFHPDVKENDGGNRVVPKKKKKSKSTLGDDGPSVSAKSSSGVSGVGGSADMELDECGEEIHEDEEGFDMDKAMVEVENYLKINPITFVSSMTAVKETPPGEKVLPPNGLMIEEDLDSLVEEEFEKKENDDIVAQENGIRCIFGRRFINGQVCASKTIQLYHFEFN